MQRQNDRTGKSGKGINREHRGGKGLRRGNMRERERVRAKYKYKLGKEGKRGEVKRGAKKEGEG